MQNPEHLAGSHILLYNELFGKLNPQCKEELDANSIATFLKTAQSVSVSQLSQIWEIASELCGCKNRAALNRVGVFICFKLVAAAQHGLPLSPAVLSNATLGPPKFDTATMNVISATRPLPKQNAFGSTRSLSISSEFGQEIGWAIGAEEQRKYDAIFDSLGPIGGKLSGDQCKPVLLNSQLSRTLLAKIWDLADMDADGFLDRVEFYVALHLIYRALQNEPIPDRLPPTLVPSNKRSLLDFRYRQMGVRSADPSMGTHAPPLTWSSRASSVASLNFQPPPPLSPPSIMPQPPIAMATPKKTSLASASPALALEPLFERNIEEWRVDNLEQFETEFNELDKDHDGLIGGADVRDTFLRSGLSQNVLARIWASVDVQKSGKLNLEQYAKCVLLIRECQEDREKCTTTSSSSVQPLPMQPTAGALGRRDSQISTNSSSGGGTIVGLVKQIPENARALELTTAIEEMQTNRRKAEQDLFQAEADLKVKNSEVKNLEIESLTLEATVKQLKNQKVEANRRLNDLDTRIAKLDGICGESQRRVDEEEARLARTKLDIQQARENSQKEDNELDNLRAMMQAKGEQLARGKERLACENAKFEGFVDELTQLERGIAQKEQEGTQLQKQITEMERILEGVGRGDEQCRKELLEQAFQEASTSEAPSTTAAPQTFSAVDPFSKGPFGTAPDNSDPFSSQPSADVNFTQTKINDDDPFASKSSRNEGATVEGIDNHVSGGDVQRQQQFANFANFDAFT